MAYVDPITMVVHPFGYVPNLAANVVGLVLFSVILVVQLISGLVSRDWWMFVTWGITAGLEVAGYSGRAAAHYYPLSFQLFEFQLVCCIIGPAFMAAGLYYQLGKQVTIYGEQYSPFNPMTYTAIFTTCDVISLIVQATGGGLAASNIGTRKGPSQGGWIMVGGITFQVLILFIFIFLYGLVNLRIFRDDPKNWNPRFAHTRKRPLFKFLIPAICVSLLFLQIRSVYRIAELSDGWTGHLMNSEKFFLVMDGLMIILGMTPLCIIFPGIAYGYVPIKGLDYWDPKEHKKDNIDENHDDNLPPLNNLILDKISSSDRTESQAKDGVA